MGWGKVLGGVLGGLGGIFAVHADNHEKIYNGDGGHELAPEAIGGAAATQVVKGLGIKWTSASHPTSAKAAEAIAVGDAYAEIDNLFKTKNIPIAKKAEAEHAAETNIKGAIAKLDQQGFFL